MTMLVKSQLNPLADAFIPTHKKKGSPPRIKRIAELIRTETEYKLPQNGKTDSNDRDNTFSKTYAKLGGYKNILSKDTYLYGKIASINSGFKKSSIIEQNYCTLESWLIGKPRISIDYQGQEPKSNVDQKLCMQQNSLPTLKCSNDWDQGFEQKSNVDQKVCLLQNSILSVLSSFNDGNKGQIQEFKVNKVCMVQNSLPQLESSYDENVERIQESNVDQKLCMVQNSLPLLESSNDGNLELIQESNVDQKLCTVQNSLPMLESFNVCDQGLVNESKTAVTSKSDLINETLNEECTCPPMFGWTVPPNFIGNPFNYKYECSKKYPHSPNSDKDINRWTLDRCYSEMQDIVADVIDTITGYSDPATEFDEEYKMEDYREGSEVENPESNEMETGEYCFVSASEASVPELIDDGVHPLLMAPAEDEEDLVAKFEQILAKVEKILEKNLSPLPESRDTWTFKLGEIGDPCSHDPCGQWCDSLPPTVRETYIECNKYIQKTEKLKENNEACHSRQSFMQRPVFKRSFSAGDAHSYELCETSAVESRDILLKRMEDPLNCFKTHSSNSLINGRKHKSCDLTDQQLYTNSKEKSSMWGKFDGVDSLWQPLPECTPLNSINQKLNIHKRGRDSRRQRAG